MASAAALLAFTAIGLAGIWAALFHVGKVGKTV